MNHFNLLLGKFYLEFHLEKSDRPSQRMPLRPNHRSRHRTNRTRENDIMIQESTTISAPSLQQIYQRLNTTPEKLVRFCEKWQIIELALFGSVLSDNFRPDGEDPSDIDLLYTNASETRYGFQFFDMQEELEKLLNRKVDLVSKRGIETSRNYLRRKSILESTQVIYAKRSTVNP